MALDNTALLPPASRFRTVLTKIGTALVPKVEAVRYFLRVPDEEELDKVVYIESAPPISLMMESIQNTQRSFSPYRVSIRGLINESDTRILIDFVQEVLDTLNTAANIESFRTAFGGDDGFTIEHVVVSELGFGIDFGQFNIIVECLFNHP